MRASIRSLIAHGDWVNSRDPYTGGGNGGDRPKFRLVGMMAIAQNTFGTDRW
jgi:hypothetical protein